MKKVAWMVIIILLLVGVGLTPLSTVTYTQKAMDIYYEDSGATAPVVIKISGGASAWKQASSSGWYTGLKGVARGYRSLSIKVTLKIGEHYSGSTWAKTSVSSSSSRATKDLNYAFSGTATFQVPASQIVPYMVQEPDEETGEIMDPQKGTLSYEVSYTAEIYQVYYKRSGSWEGPVNIEIVGSVSDYLPEAVEPGDVPTDPPEDTQDTTDQNQDNLDDTQVSDQDGGSKIYTMGSGWGFQMIFSVPLIFSILVIVILIALRKG